MRGKAGKDPSFYLHLNISEGFRLLTQLFEKQGEAKGLR
jgi:hypothetical protein